MSGRCPRSRVGSPNTDPQGKGRPILVLEVGTSLITTLYVITDDFCRSRPPKRHPGLDASLSDGEVITLALFARWSRFAGERDSYRALPHRAPLRRLPGPARSLPARSAGALLHGTRRGDGPAPGKGAEGRGMPLRGSGQLGAARPRRPTSEGVPVGWPLMPTRMV